VLPISSEEGNLSYLDALFEATSAVCVTGLAVVDTTRLSRFGQTVILFLIQLGGLGIVTFFHLIHFYAKAHSVGDNSWYDKGLYSIVG